MAKKKTKFVPLKGVVDDTMTVESFEKLQVNLGFSSVDHKIQLIQITSSLQDEGKTTVAVNLANSYAIKGDKVLVVDLDIRRPKIHRNFNQVNENGIVDFVTGNVRKEDLIKKTVYGIDVVTTGSKTPYPVKILESEKLQELLEEARSIYDIIILDTPPVTAVIDPIVISKYSDAVLFVVQADRVKKVQIKDALKQLEMAGANIAGLVMTNVKAQNSFYNKYKYYQE